jgi:putative transposase
MKKRYTEEHIIKAIKEHEAGVKMDDICHELNISTGRFYNWRSQYAGLEVNAARHLRALESENNTLKHLRAEKLLEVEAMKDVLSKKW